MNLINYTCLPDMITCQKRAEQVNHQAVKAAVGTFVTLVRAGSGGAPAAGNVATVN